ncbi:ATP-binding protein [Oceanihabitans sp. 2_MG-2023]|uniref:ATP-binding protein n=1 Tax=Oceanihabitans sp. 2_MG-2023 TaxID=3062661 RepID=UPI0026E3AF76|nr:ATP-binding protein [Oceanihabitans sp. 2_MG-2023]MDO6595312.1 ATP-binding protein [Oceanihabitans sp. 2_MG-2023]
MGQTETLKTIYNEIDWLQKVIDQVLKSYLKQEDNQNKWQDIPLPNLENKRDYYATSVINWELNIYQRLVLVLAMTPNIKPEILDVFLEKNQIYKREFTAFGGIIDEKHRGFLPTGETVMFLISATNPALRYEAMHLFNRDSILIKEDVIALSKTKKYIPKYNGILSLNDQWLDYFITGYMQEVKQIPSFLAKKISTKLEWNDLVLDNTVLDQIFEIKTWLQHGSTIMKDWKLEQRLKPGFRAFFHGPPGTGKTLTATLLGKVTNRDVYRIDLSMVISKYIGETEKNLSKLFDKAEQKGWILFFDEADALFGKRTNVSDAHDSYANQEVSYLLQRIEDFSGVVILSSNLKNNIDQAFIRRFQSIIPFSMPNANSRYQLWKNTFSNGCKLSKDIDVRQLAQDYELSGGGINNVLRFCALKAVERNSIEVTKKELLEGIKKEFQKKIIL